MTGANTDPVLCVFCPLSTHLRRYTRKRRSTRAALAGAVSARGSLLSMPLLALLAAALCSLGGDFEEATTLAVCPGASSFAATRRQQRSLRASGLCNRRSL